MSVACSTVTFPHRALHITPARVSCVFAMLPFHCWVLAGNGIADGVPSVVLRHGVLPGSKIEMPILAAGTAGYNDSAAMHAVQRALSAGFSHVHTAYDYYNLHGVARGLKASSRGSYFLSSMTSPCIHGAPPMRNVTDPKNCYALTIAEASTLLEQLQVNTIDLLMLHGPSERFGHIGACSKLACDLARAQWEAYVSMLRSGRVQAIGVSNFCQSCLKCLEGSDGHSIVPAVNQIQLHVGQGSADPGPGLLSFCSQRGIVVQGYEPLAGGSLASNAFCSAIALKYNKTAAQVALKWVLQRAPSLVVRAGSDRHLAQDLDIFDFTLDGSDLEGLDAQMAPPGEAGGRCSWGCTE